MQKSIRFMASILILGAYLLSACTGAAPSQSSDPAKAQKVDSSEVVFTGIVEAINGEQWTVNGQTVVIDGLTALDVNIKVGDVVKVEANVSQDGSVVAVKIESSVTHDANSNSSNDNSANANDDNSNDANANSNDNSNANDNSNGNTNGNTNGNDNSAVDGQDEVFGVVGAVTSDTITVDGIVYNLADFTEFKDGIVVGDLVKIHVIVNADGTLTIREIEKSAGIGADDNSNGNSNGDDNSNGNSNDDDNSNGNSNDDDNSNGNSNDDDLDDDNSNDNSGGDDNSGNSNGNDD